MNSFKKLLLIKSIFAAAVAAGGIAAPVVSHANPTGTADDGMVCRNGYTGALIGTRFVCSKTSSTDIKLDCTSPNFPVYVIRLGGPGPDGDKDICIRNNGTVITINQSLQGLTESTNGISGVYEFAKVKANGRAGGKGEATVPLTFFTYAIAGPAVVQPGGPIVISNPGPFVPRPLP